MILKEKNLTAAPETKTRLLQHSLMTQNCTILGEPLGGNFCSRLVGGGEELEQANLQKFKFQGGCLWDGKASN